MTRRAIVAALLVALLAAAPKSLCQASERVRILPAMNLLEAMAFEKARADILIRQAAITEVLERADRYKITRYFHDCLPGCVPGSPKRSDHVPLPGNQAPTCRVLYVKSLQFFAAGLTHKERVYLAANRIGKTETAAYEATAHLTGRYPEWWRGKRIVGPNKWWAAGDTRMTTRDIVQNALMGRHEGVPTKQWSGMIPPHLVVDAVNASGGVAHCLDTVYVQHVERHHGAPCISEIQFKSYDQGRRVFQGTELNGGIWLDEEPPDGVDAQESQAQGSSDIWTECLLRLMTTEGLLLATFTPLRGMTPFLNQYISTAMMPGTEGDIAAADRFFPDAATDAGLS